MNFLHYFQVILGGRLHGWQVTAMSKPQAQCGTIAYGVFWGEVPSDHILSVVTQSALVIDLTMTHHRCKRRVAQSLIYLL